LIVAVDNQQVSQLEVIKQRGFANGCDELQYLTTHSMRTLTPELKAIEVLFSPKTGIVDSHALMIAMLGDFESSSGHLVCSSEISFVEVKNGYYEIGLNDSERSLLQTKILINAAGLDATNFACKIDALKLSHIPEFSLAKGSYFTYAGKCPFSHLIYPVPEKGGLGIHLTLDLHGQAKFGPDVEWIDHINYTVDAAKADNFYKVISKYWPSCDRQKLMPGYSGIRPKIGNCIDFLDDFIIQTEVQHGLKGLVNLFGIESPGLTSCMAIADYVFESLIELED
jgi:L-2-hydroxyglutarate oxidase LhgO